jgi:hypothetical protein
VYTGVGECTWVFECVHRSGQMCTQQWSMIKSVLKVLECFQMGGEMCTEMSSKVDVGMVEYIHRDGSNRKLVHCLARMRYTRSTMVVLLTLFTIVSF